MQYHAAPAQPSLPHIHPPSLIQYRDQILEKIRCTVEACDSLQSFLLLHSLGGGTGSGLGTYILELLAVSGGGREGGEV